MAELDPEFAAENDRKEEQIKQLIQENSQLEVQLVSSMFQYILKCNLLVMQN